MFDPVKASMYIVHTHRFSFYFGNSETWTIYQF